MALHTYTWHFVGTPSHTDTTGPRRPPQQAHMNNKSKGEHLKLISGQERALYVPGMRRQTARGCPWAQNLPKNLHMAAGQVMGVSDFSFLVAVPCGSSLYAEWYNPGPYKLFELPKSTHGTWKWPGVPDMLLRGALSGSKAGSVCTCRHA